MSSLELCSGTDLLSAYMQEDEWLQTMVTQDLPHACKCMRVDQKDMYRWRGGYV